MDIVGLRLGPVRHTWTERDAILYALGIGARLPEDLPYLYEGADGRGPEMEPTLALTAATIMLPPLIEALDIDILDLLHATQALEVLRPWPVEGTCEVTRTVTGVWDKGRAAIVDCEDAVVDDDGPLAIARSSWWIEGRGGFDGPRRDPAAVPIPEPPDRAPDATHEAATTAEQAALYRLSGDRNPVHIDPEVARAAGQPGAFLHGLCTLGLVGHALTRRAGAGGQTPVRLATLAGRFTSPVFPGADVTSEIWWTDPRTAVARVTSGGTSVLSPVHATFTDA